MAGGVFISYARADTDRISIFESKLESVAIDVWRDSRIPIGEEFRNHIAAALEKAEIVVVLWTKASCLSDWVRHEANYAVNNNKLVSICVGVKAPKQFERTVIFESDNFDDFSLSTPGLVQSLRSLQTSESHFRDIYRVARSLLYLVYSSVFAFVLWKVTAAVIAGSGIGDSPSHEYAILVVPAALCHLFCTHAILAFTGRVRVWPPTVSALNRACRGEAAGLFLLVLIVWSRTWTGTETFDAIQRQALGFFIVCIPAYLLALSVVYIKYLPFFVYPRLREAFFYCESRL